MKSGIYKIENALTHDFYIGCSIFISKRWLNHKSELRRNAHSNKRLQSSWNNYDENTFMFTTILFCEESELLYYERALIKRLCPSYNIAYPASRGHPPKDRSQCKLNVSIRLYPPVITAILTAPNIYGVQSWIETAIHEKLERDDIKVIPAPLIR